MIEETLSIDTGFGRNAESSSAPYIEIMLTVGFGRNITLRYVTILSRISYVVFVGKCQGNALDP